MAHFRVEVNFVEVPVTVKDSKGNLVAGLTWRDFPVYENNVREQLQLFTVDPAPFSIAFVVDQSLTSDVMPKVNKSLDAIQGALTPYDEVAVFTYSNGAKERTGFTGAQSARLPSVLSWPRPPVATLVPVNSGPFAGLQHPRKRQLRRPQPAAGPLSRKRAVHHHPQGDSHPERRHPSAAKELSTRPKGRRRIIYVISDGKEYGSKATYKEVVRYLQTNKIAVYGTLVGDSARWGEGCSPLPSALHHVRQHLYKYVAGHGRHDGRRGRREQH